MNGVRQLWEIITTSTPAPSIHQVLATAVAAAALVLIPSLWRVTRYAVTIPHEGAHALIGLLFGRRLQGIKLHSDTSGVTVSRGRPAGFGMACTLLAGYIGPAIAGLGIALLVAAGYSTGALWLLLLFLALLGFYIRNWFGILIITFTGGALFAVTWWATSDIQTMFAYLVAWFLLIAAPRPVLELQGSRRRGTTRTSDADQLARLTKVPGIVWIGLFLLMNLGALTIGGYLLIIST